MVLLRSPLPWVVGALLLGLHLGARGAVAVPAALFGVSLGITALLRARRWTGASVSLLLAGGALGAWIEGMHPRWTPRPLRATDAREVYGVLERPCVPRGARTSCVLIEPDGSRVLLSFTGAACPARVGDAVRAIATLIPVQPALNEGRLGPGASLARQGIHTRAESAACEVEPRLGGPRDWVRRAGDALRRALTLGIERVFSSVAAARARALLFGDDDALDPEVSEGFRRTGLSHLLAVSGAHVSLVFSALAWAARALGARARPVVERGLLPLCEAVFAWPAVVVFVCATGESPSAVRALTMAGLSLLARLRWRRPDGASVLAASAMLTLCAAPHWREDVGWQLSVAASWALVSARRAETDELSAAMDEAPGARAALARAVKSLRDQALEALGLTARVALLTAPLVAGLGGRIPLLGLLANIVAAPVGEVLALPLVLLATLAGAVSPTLGTALAWPAEAALTGMFSVSARAAVWPLASIECPPPTPGQCAVWLALVAAGLLAARRRTRAGWVLAAVLAVLALEIVHRREVHPRGILRVTAIDVGQGDALLIDLPDGEALLVDGGGVVQGADPGARMVLPFLAMRRRRELAAVVATHPHPDHVNGLRAVLDWATVGALWDTRQSERWRGGVRWLAERTRIEQRGVPVCGPESLCVGARDFHGARLEVLAPCDGLDERTSPNDGSFVLRLSHGRASVLLPGDLEAGGERALLGRLQPVTALKLGHHGSRTSSTEPWLRALSPRVAIVSAGHPSPWGHPHPSVRDRLGSLGIPLFSTSERGAITLSLRPDGRWSVLADGSVFEGGP
jgi:competence protein ComEC